MHSTYGLQSRVILVIEMNIYKQTVVTVTNRLDKTFIVKQRTVCINCKKTFRLVVVVVVVVVVINFIKHQNRAITGERVAARAAPSYQYAMVLVIIT